MDRVRIKRTLTLTKSFLAIYYGFARTGLLRFLRKKGILRAHPTCDVLVISYPKSGRTWLRVMLDYLDINLEYKHNVVDLPYRPMGSYEDSYIDRDKYRDKRVIFLMRDPRDTLVSSYFQELNREQSFEGSISDFVRSPEFGIHRILQYQATWIRSRHIPKDFLLIRYEDMREDPVGTLRSTLRFLGVSSISQRKLRNTVELFTFDTMQYFEKRGLFRVRYGRILRPLGNRGPDSLKVRRGIVGGYVDYLSEEDMQYCDGCIEEMGFVYYQ